MGQSNYLTLLFEGLKNTDYSVRHAAINSLYPIFCTNNYGKIKQKCEEMLETEKERAVRGAAQKLLETMRRELS